MGCDIHIYLEQSYGSDVWESINFIEVVEIDCTNINKLKNYAVVPYSLTPFSNKCYVYTAKEQQGSVSDRDYNLFAELFNVRGSSVLPNNEYALANKGIPSNASSLVSAAYNICADDWHSATYFTLKELRQYIEENYNNYLSASHCNLKCIVQFYKELHKIATSYVSFHEVNALSYIYELLYSQRDLCEPFERYNIDENCRAIVWFDN